MAKGVVGVLQQQLPADAAQLQPVHLWLGRMPHAGMHMGVWRVVLLAALQAMDKGRRLLAKWQLQQQQGQVMPQHIMSQPQRITVATQVAVATVWDMLQDFVSLRLCPPTWLLHLAPGHPFLAVRVNARGEPEVCVRHAQQ